MHNRGYVSTVEAGPRTPATYPQWCTCLLWRTLLFSSHFFFLSFRSYFASNNDFAMSIRRVWRFIYSRSSRTLIAGSPSFAYIFVLFSSSIDVLLWQELKCFGYVQVRDELAFCREYASWSGGPRRMNCVFFGLGGTNIFCVCVCLYCKLREFQCLKNEETFFLRK